jgi:hypothetical protein
MTEPPPKTKKKGEKSKTKRTKRILNDKEKLQGKRALACTFITLLDAPTKTSVQEKVGWALWDKLKIRVLTHCPLPDNGHKVFCWSRVSMRITQWHKIIHCLMGIKGELLQVHKTKSFFDVAGKSKAAVALLKQNSIELDPPDPAVLPPVIEPLVVVPLTPRDFLQTPLHNNLDDIFQVARNIFPAAWATNFFTTHMGQELWVLDIHRRFLLIESYLQLKLSAKYTVETIPSTFTTLWSDPVRKQVLSRKYLIMDPLTFFIPLLVHQLQIPLEMKDFEHKRYQLVLDDIQPLVKHGNLLNDTGKKEFGDDWVPLSFPSVPPLSPLNPNPWSDETCKIRKNKENRFTMACMSTLETSPWVSMYQKMIDVAPKILAMDSLEKSYTQYLPPTTSMPHAQWDPVKFLELE